MDNNPFQSTKCLGLIAQSLMGLMKFCNEILLDHLDLSFETLVSFKKKELLTHKEYFQTSDNLSPAKYKSIFVLGNLILYVQILF